MADGYTITELRENKDGTRFKLILYPCDDNVKVAASTGGLAYLEGTKDQFRCLLETLKQDFEEDDE